MHGVWCGACIICMESNMWDCAVRSAYGYACRMQVKVSVSMQLINSQQLTFSIWRARYSIEYSFIWQLLNMQPFILKITLLRQSFCFTVSVPISRQLLKFYQQVHIICMFLKYLHHQVKPVKR